MKKQNPFKKLSTWIKNHRKTSLIIGGLILILGSGIAAYVLLSKEAPQPEHIPPITTVKKDEPKFYAPLTGTQLASEAAMAKPVTAIMIENSPDARPQSGLKQSEVVFEAIAEGGITRFLALYQQEKPQLVGPVRSLRMYYVDWLAPFDASVAHVGGSAAALTEIRNGKYRDIDQFFNAGTYWRATDRYAPHNVYTSFEKLDALNQAKSFTQSAPQPFDRTDATPAELPAATAIQVKMSSAAFNSSYTYDAASKLYARSQAGAAHVDREAGQITPRVVIVMKVPMTLVQEDGLRQQYTTVGSGSATIFQDGTAQEVTWTKSARSEQIHFTDAAGASVPLARGQTWISAIPSDTGAVTWQ